jgi:hypothetical protein
MTPIGGSKIILEGLSPTSEECFFSPISLARPVRCPARFQVTYPNAYKSAEHSVES